MRFKIDENLPEEAARVLREAGHDARTVLDQGLRGVHDADLAVVCRRESRALVTLDVDFADIRTYPPSEYPGLIVLRLRRTATAQVVDAVTRLIPLLRSETVQGRLWIVDEVRVRIRE